MKKPAKTGLLAASLVLVGASAVACSGGPSDASEDEFCKEFTSLSSKLGPLTETSQKEALAAIKSWAKGLDKVGTTEEMSEEAREGFELMVAEVAELDADDLADGLQTLDDELSESEQKATDAFEKYTEDTCGAMQFDTPELPEVPAP